MKPSTTNVATATRSRAATRSSVGLACAVVTAVAAFSSAPVGVVDAFVPRPPIGGGSRGRGRSAFVTRVASTTEEAPLATTTESANNVKTAAGFFFASSPDDLDDVSKPMSAATAASKTAEEAAFLKDALLSDFETKFDAIHLSFIDVNNLVEAFEKVSVTKGTKVCTQGEVGDYFYVVQRGAISFLVDDKDVGSANAGQSFGELALLYDCPRAATCVVSSDEGCDLWRVDKATFRKVLYSTPAPVIPKTQQEEEFLREALTHDRILDAVALEESEIDTLVGAFERHTVADGEDVVTQGEDGNHFYLIESGDVKFIVDDKDVGMTGEGRTFGELALLFNAPRAATVRAFGGDTSLWRVDRHTFRSVLGGKSLDRVNVYSKRVDLKKRLEKSTLLGMSGAGSADDAKDGEDVMKQLETIRPIARPAYHCSMNGDWCMVKAGVETLDMSLITFLSTISRIAPFIVDFEDVYITLGNSATLVTCNIFLKLFKSFNFRINAFTGLECDDDHPEGTLMYESFQGMAMMGVDVPLPNLAVARPLEITYLDEDVMIARNDGGEPHLLVRIRSCPDEDPDHKYTGFFENARLLYGERITRCLVDRGFGAETEEASEGGSDARTELMKLLDEDRGEKCPITGKTADQLEQEAKEEAQEGRRVEQEKKERV